MNAWQGGGKFSILIQRNTEKTMESLFSAKQGGLTGEQHAKVFHRKSYKEM
jgi:hypothetical protein